MSLLGRIRAALRREPPPSAPVLKNKAGGIAWCNVIGKVPGVDELHGRIVCTKSFAGDGKWVIDPPQYITATSDYLYRGLHVHAGDQACVTGLHDDCLMPIDHPGDEERDQSCVWLPPVPAPSREPA